MKLNYTSLQHPVEPVERRCSALPDILGRGTAERTLLRAIPVLVLPLHGHLAPAGLGRRRRRSAGAEGRLRADRRRRAAGVVLPRRRDAARARPALRPRHRRPRLRRRARGAQRRRRPRRRRAPARLGRGDRRPRPGDHRLRDAARPRRHGRPRHRPRGAVPGHADPDLPAPLRRRPPRAPPRRQPPHPHRPRAAAGPGRASPSRRERTRSSRQLAHGRRRATPAADGGGGPRGLRRHRPAVSHDGAGHRGGPALLRARCLCAAGAALRRRPRQARSSASPCVKGCRREANLPAMAIAVKPPQPLSPPASSPGADARFEGLVLDFLSYLELERGPLPQHAQRLPHRPAPVRRVPRRPPRRRARRPPGRHRRVPRRAGDRQRPPALLGLDHPPQGRLPALLLQAPAPRRADRRRPDRRPQRAAAGEEAAPGPQLLRGAAAARLAARRRADDDRATGRCSR